MIVDLDRAVRRLESNGQWSDPAPLSTYRYAPAYVLLGDPGAGKSTALGREQSATPRSEPVTARDFRTIYGEALSARTETLFVDGLDEARAGGGDPRGPLDRIRGRLKRLAPKRVRLSCRELDWLGDNDRTNLSKVVPGGEVIVLRLEPLNAEEQRRIIRADPRIADPADFVIKAADRGVEGLLTNAQTLSLLVRVVAEDGAFPGGRTETFEDACRLLAREPNDEHRVAAPLPEPEEVVETAGCMCVVSLLSGAAGFSVSSARESDGFVPIPRFGARAGSAERAAHTRLFTSVGGGQFVPVHANIAAFLAAQHLARLVDGQVPAGRILALLRGNDGCPPTPLRSLVAWLAAMSTELRSDLIGRDPVAVLLYGDVRDFSPDEKTLLIEEIARDPARLGEAPWPASAVAALATPDMGPEFRRVLRDPDRSDSRQEVAALVLTALTRTANCPGLTADLDEVWRDATRASRVRGAALDAWIAALSKRPDGAKRLRAALGKLGGGNIFDPDHEFRGVLLRKLYPGHLEPAAIWTCLVARPRLVFNTFWMFWRELPERCPPDDLPAHLDQLSHGPGSLRGLVHDLCEDLASRLLARALDEHGERIEAGRLLGWLQAGLNERGRAPTEFGPESAAQRVREWLEAHPEAQKAVVRIALRTEEFTGPGALDHRLNQLLYQASLPRGLDRWHLDEAVGAEDHRSAQAHLIGLVRVLVRRPADADAGLTSARRRLARRPTRLRHLEDLLSSPLTANYLEKMKQIQSLVDRRAQPDTRLREALRSAEVALRDNRAAPGLLDALAQRLAWERQTTGPTDARAHLMEVLEGDEALINAALDALRGAIERDDLPSAEGLVAIRRQGRISPLAWPVLIGLDDRPPDDILDLDEGRIRAALACRLLVPGLGERADWYRRCVADRPDLVAEVLVLVGRALMKAGETSIPVSELVHDAEHGPVAKTAVLPLLRAFPVRAKSDNLFALHDLLVGALVFGDRTGFRDLLEQKLRSRSMTAGQRTRWLAAAVILDSGAFLSELAQQVGRNELRIRGLARFFDGALSLHDRLDPSVLEFLVGTIGAGSDPPPEHGVFRVTPGLEVTPRLIEELGDRPDPAAAAALRRLLDDPDLHAWRPMLQHARDRQRVAQRDTSYTPPSAAALMDALADGPPANAPDLRELVVDRLRRIAGELRTTNANLWRQFWNEDPEKPKHENACRDALLAMLRERLPDGCDAQPEGHYAANRRADIRVASGSWNVPVEIKKDSHRDVWRAAPNQLLPRYANDPATGGLGIFLVLWFGREHDAPNVTGKRPSTSDALHDQLLANLTPGERSRAAVIVMDVTKTGPARCAVADRPPRHRTGAPIRARRFARSR